ncbi:MAG: response regulator transcription factor [Lachnospiraceae bacterium]|nr:response regulator transcription factor [Lachnospiraceae bacterium]
MIRILIVEDDENIAKMIEAVLSIGGYEGIVCNDGAQALHKLLTESFDLALLDVMLPGLDGFEILEGIQGREVPVIFLTARLDVADKVRGLRLGAEDYIVKPFEAVELLARIEVVLRRVNKSSSVLSYEDITVDIQKHRVTKGGAEISLTPREFEVLVFFLQHVDIALTRERLLSAVWDYSFEGESRTVDIHVQQVRRKLGLQGRLVTIPKLGWRLERQ